MSEDEGAIRQQYWRKRNKGGKQFPCPTCKQPHKLTAFEKSKGYQCDACADRAEGSGF